MMEKLRNVIKKLHTTGFFSIISSTVIMKIFSFCQVFIVVRLLSKADYGLYSYVNNLISIIMLLDGLGCVSGILQFGSESINDKNKKNGFFLFGAIIGIIVNTLMAVAIIIFAVTADFKIEGTKLILLLMCAKPMMDFLFNILSTNLRINFLNNQYSLLNIISVSMAFICVILGAALWKVVGIIVLLYVSSILSIIIALLMNKNLLKDIKEYTVLTKKEKNQFFKQSIFSSFSAASSNLMQMLDVFIIGIVISDAFIIADYKTATTIPSALYFISQAVMIYFYPYFAAKKDNQEWVKKTIILILIFLTATSIIIGAVFIPGAPFIMKIVFGEQYISCVPVFRILVVSVMIGNVFKSLCNNLMLAYKKATINFMFAFFDGGLNIIFDIVLIVKYGSIGAAYATLAITGVSSVVHFIVLLLVIKKHNKGITKNGNENSSNTILVDNGGDDEAMVNSFNT